MFIVMKLRFLILGFILFFGFNGYSQITSLADFSEKTEFADSIEIFVFCTDDINGGSLVAVDSSNNGGYNFTWYEFDETDTTLTKLFAGSINDDVDGKTSTITGLANGGYRVVLTKADTTQEYFAWVYNNVGRSVEIQFDPILLAEVLNQFRIYDSRDYHNRLIFGPAFL